MSEERRTTISIYAADLEWLKQYQREVSGRRQEWLWMPDTVRQLIHDADLRKQEGIVMVPVVENIDAFNQRTEELRAQGFAVEAGARDRFIRREGNRNERGNRPE